MPGEPNPWYSEPQFSAWNVVAEEYGGDPHHLPVPAPTWSDTGETFIATGRGPNGGGVALAERASEDQPGRASESLDERADEDLAGQAGQGFAELSDEGQGTRAARLTGEGTPVLAIPAEIVAAPAVASPHDADAGPQAEPQESLSDAATGVANATARTRAATARARKTARRKGRVRRRVVVAGVCLPAIAVIAAMAYVHHPAGSVAGSSPGSHAAQAAASVSHPSSSLGPWQHIGTRAADRAPLTLSQLFPAQFTVGTASYTRTAQLGSTHCPRAVFGTRLQAAVRKYGCSQVMRASYLASAQKLMGTIGVLNLGNSAGASRVGRVTGFQPVRRPADCRQRPDS